MLQEGGVRSVVEYPVCLQIFIFSACGDESKCWNVRFKRLPTKSLYVMISKCSWYSCKYLLHEQPFWLFLAKCCITCLLTQCCILLNISLYVNVSIFQVKLNYFFHLKPWNISPFCFFFVVMAWVLVFFPYSPICLISKYLIVFFFFFFFFPNHLTVFMLFGFILKFYIQSF